MMDNMIDVAKEVLADKETFAALDSIAGTVLEKNVLALEVIRLHGVLAGAGLQVEITPAFRWPLDPRD